MRAALPRRCLVLLSIGLLTFGACTAGPAPGAAPPPAAVTTAPTATVPHVPDGWAFALDKPAAVGDQGMVVTDQAQATEAGLAVLRDGGNAVDAAVATAFALAVVLPSAGNIGGGGFLVAHVDGTEPRARLPRDGAGGRRSRDMYLDARGETGDRSVTGHLAAGVPGSVAGLWAAHQKLGSKPWASLVEPAIRLAEDGFEVDGYAAGVIKAEAERLARFPASASLYVPGGTPLAVGARLKNPDLARTLRRIAEHGRDGFYKGETADAARRRDEARQGHHHRERPRRL